MTAKNRFQFIPVILLLLVTGWVKAQVHAPAGSIIQNQAVADIAGDIYLSNVVETVVLPFCEPSLLPNGTPTDPAQRVAIGIGGRAVLPYTLSNAGNKDFDFSLSWQLSNASDWVAKEAVIYLDANQNGSLDPGEPKIQTVNLEANETVYLLLVVRAPANALGSLYITPTATCPDGNKDDENFSEIVVYQGPALAVEKSFSKPEAEPGDIVGVTLYVRNLGDQPAEDEVILSDDLSALENLEYVPGSAEAPKGTIEYFDGANWQPEEPDRVLALRLRLPGLEVGEEALLSFKVQVLPGTAPGRVENRAMAEGPGGPAEITAPLKILPYYAHHLGPKGHPLAVGDEDRQKKTAFAGQQVCFEHTLLNEANVDDRFTIEYSGLPEGIPAVLLTPQGTVLPQPIPLGPGESYNFKICVNLPESGVDPFVIELIAKSLTSEKVDPTYDEVSKVLPLDQLALSKEVAPEGTVSAGTTLTYTLTVRNDYEVDLHNVVIQDPLDEHLLYESSTPDAEYSADTHTLTWELPLLSAGQVWQATVTVKVREDTPDDTVIQNRFYVTSDELTEPIVSPPAENNVWSTAIQIKKEVSPTEVRIGDRVHYKIHLLNPGSVTVTVDLTDTPDPRLEYIKGSASPLEPEVVDGSLVWREVTLEPGEEKIFEYDMRVLAEASGDLVNVAVAQGQSANGSAVSTGRVRALVKVEDTIFVRRKATVIGRVFLDFNRDGKFDEGKDYPLPGARLVLSNGLQAVTDGEGRYGFRDLEPGVWLIKLDAESAPFEPLPHPEALGDGYTHRLDAYGLTTSDFPLAPPQGWIKGYRSTRLSMGPLTVEKELLPLGDGRYRVVLRLSTTEPLPEFELRDPLPGGGERTFTFDPLVGEKTLTYDLEAPAWLTDPEVRWRYP